MKRYLLSLNMLCAAAFAEEGFAKAGQSYPLLAETMIAGPWLQMKTNDEVIANQPSETTNNRQDQKINNKSATETKTSKWNNNSIIHLGGSYTYVQLAVQGSGPFHGNLGGMQTSYEFKPKNCLYEGLFFSWRQGATNHESQTRFLLDFNTQERIGYTFAGGSDREWMLTLFTGFGFRYLGHNLKQPQVSNLKFKYKEFYVPVGLLVNGDLASYCNIGLNLLWLPQVFSTVEIIPLDGTNWSIERSLENCLVELPIVFTFTKRKNFSIEIKPFFEYWRDGKTNAKTKTGLHLDVPGNIYRFYGAQLNLGYAF